MAEMGALAKGWFHRKRIKQGTVSYRKYNSSRFSSQGRLPSISAMVGIGNASTKPRNALKARSISTLKRCGNYNNSVSSVKFDLAWVGIPPGVPDYLPRDSSHLSHYIPR